MMSYTPPGLSAVASQVDIMTTQQTDLSCSSPSTVNLTFSHRCADFRFILNNSTGETVTVNSITLKNFYRSGELHESTWTTTGAVQDFTLSVGTDVAAANSHPAVHPRYLIVATMPRPVGIGGWSVPLFALPTERAAYPWRLPYQRLGAARRIYGICHEHCYTGLGSRETAHRAHPFRKHL